MEDICIGIVSRDIPIGDFITISISERGITSPDIIIDPELDLGTLVRKLL